MPGRTTEIYLELFSALRDALIGEFGDIGPPKIVLMDRELAAHNAIEQIFPEFTVRSCSFHFAKNVLDYAKNNDLSSAFSNAKFSAWIKELLGRTYFSLLSFLYSIFRMYFFAEVLHDRSF